MPDHLRLIVGNALIILALITGLFTVFPRVYDPFIAWPLVALCLSFGVWGCLFLKPDENAELTTRWTRGERFTTIFVSLVLSFAWIPALGIVMQKFSVTVPLYGHFYTVWLPSFVIGYADLWVWFGMNSGVSLVASVVFWAAVSAGIVIGTIFLVDEQIRLRRANQQDKFE